MSDLKPFLEDMLSMSTGADGRTLQIHFCRPVTMADRQAMADAHNAIVRGEINQPPAPVSGGIETAARAYVSSVNGEPEKDCWDTEDGKEAPGAERFASDWAWKAYDDKKQKAFDDLRAALAASEGSTE